jgi:hypothetical protein
VKSRSAQGTCRHGGCGVSVSARPQAERGWAAMSGRGASRRWPWAATCPTLCSPWPL